MKTVKAIKSDIMSRVLVLCTWIPQANYQEHLFFRWRSASHRFNFLNLDQPTIPLGLRIRIGCFFLANQLWFRTSRHSGLFNGCRRHHLNDHNRSWCYRCCSSWKLHFTDVNGLTELQMTDVHREELRNGRRRTLDRYFVRHKSQLTCPSCTWSFTVQMNWQTDFDRFRLRNTGKIQVNDSASQRIPLDFTQQSGIRDITSQRNKLAAMTNQSADASSFTANKTFASPCPYRIAEYIQSPAIYAHSTNLVLLAF